MKKILLFCLFAALIFSCSQGNTMKSGKAGAPSYAVKVENVTFSIDDIKKEFEDLPPDVQMMFTQEYGMEGLAEELAKREMLHLEARKKGVQNNEEFRKRLDTFKKRLMVEMLLEKEVNSKAVVSDQEIMDFYEENKESFLRDAPSGSTPDFETYKGVIEQYLTAMKQTELFDEYVASLKESYKMQINQDLIRETFGGPEATVGEEGQEAIEPEAGEELQPEGVEQTGMEEQSMEEHSEEE